MRPGETESRGLPLPLPTTCTGGGGVAARAVDEGHPRRVEQEHDADVAARLAAVGLSFAGSIWRHS